MSIMRLRSYRCTLWPESVPAENLNEAAAAGALPFVQVKAVNGSHAASLARAVTGQRVLDVERRDPQGAPVSLGAAA